MNKEIEDLTKAIDLGQLAVDVLLKSHVKAYTRTTASGASVQVKEHDDKRQAAEEASKHADKSSKSAIPSSRVTVATTEHEMSHGKMPKGVGRWMFSRNRKIDFANHKEGEDYIVTPNMPYSEAKEHAKQWAASKGHDQIWTMP